MPIPNNGLITETNRQYYEGAQGFVQSVLGNLTFPTTFNTDLIYGSYDPNDIDYALNNYKLYISPTGFPGSFNEVVTSYSVLNNTIVFPLGNAPALNSYIVVQLKTLNGGNYGTTFAEMAYGNTVENNYGSYSYITLNDIVNNFMVAYVGVGKLISDVKRTDIIFHAKRCLQEFSYDTLKSIKSQELNVPHNLSVVLPQDYVNYVKISWIDHLGVKHPLYPGGTLTINPFENPIQDTSGVPIQDNFNSNIEGDSLTERRWDSNNIIHQLQNFYNVNNQMNDWNNYGINDYGYGRHYGLDPQYANINGYFTINEREGKISFSSDLIDKLIVLEYISDGLAYDMDTKFPKLAEEAVYSYILHAVISLRIGQPEYLVQRLRREKTAKLRNTKIRLSNIKLEEITQVLRGKSKWIKH